MKKNITSLFILSIIVSLLYCKESSIENNYRDLSAYGIDIVRLNEVYSDAEDIDGIYSLVVSRYGDIVAEEYFHRHSADMVHDVRSVTKSLTSILIGIAIDKGFIPYVNEKILNYISPLVSNFDEDKKAITIEHLLTMSDGFQWPPIGDWSEYNRWINAPDQINHVMDKPIIHIPGTVFNYNDGASHLLSVILTEATKLSEKEFANKYLFNYLGIDDRPWRTDNRGYNLGNVAVELTSRDMIKIGNLFLNNGIYDGEQVVSRNWIEESTRNHMPTGISIEYEKYYGYLWWVYDSGGHSYYFANGYGGQFIVVIPELELVVVATNKWSGVGDKANEYWYKTITMIIEELIPAFH